MVSQVSKIGQSTGTPIDLRSAAMLWWRMGRLETALGLAVVLASLGGCATRPSGPVPKAAPPAVPAPSAPTQAAQAEKPLPPPKAALDPIDALIAESQARFDAGRRELAVGHLESARREFDAAIDVLVQSPYGARYDARLREQFERLIDRISAHEMAALAEGDGFTEKRYEPASIDALLAESTFATVAASAKTGEIVASDLARTVHDVPIPQNERVLAYVELFQGRLREWFQTSLQRGAQYLPMIQDVFRAEGLPLDLAYVPIVESAFRPDALSRAKAKGVWQFMAATAAENGLKRDWYVDERSDPEKATHAAAAYLRTLSRAFDGDWHLALASYNGGPGTVQRAMTRYRLDDFWALAARRNSLPRETREYVPMVLAAMVIARNPLLYGFELAPVAPVEYDRVQVRQPIDLRKIAEWSGTTVSNIEALNPELRRWTTPVPRPGREAYEIKVPKGGGAALEARLAELSPADTAALKWYTVKRGDSLTTIAKKLRVSRVDLADANYLSSRSVVTPGQSLVIPVEPSKLLARAAERAAPAAASRAGSTAAKTAPPKPAPAAPTETVKVTYQVKRGDTLSSVAMRYRTTVASIMALNGLKSDRLMPGARLTIQTPRADRRPQP
jgi:membrane-bound lytic murein transglycosylase D